MAEHVSEFESSSPFSVLSESFLFRYNIVIYSDGDLEENSWESRVVQFLVVRI